MWLRFDVFGRDLLARCFLFEVGRGLKYNMADMKSFLWNNIASLRDAGLKLIVFYQYLVPNGTSRIFRENGFAVPEGPNIGRNKYQNASSAVRHAILPLLFSMELVSGYIPAKRASQLDPIESLRFE
jgi:hypothetical protein